MLAAFLFLFLWQADPYAEGMKALQEQRWDAALTSFTAAAAKDPKDYASYFHLALAQSMAGRPAEAVANYRKTLDLKPGLYEAQLNLGILLISQKQAPEAAALLGEAVKQKPKEFRPVYYLGEALLAAGNASEALPHFQAATELDPKSADAELGLGRALAKTGRFEEAAPRYQRASELDPALRRALLELAGLYEAAGKRDEAVALYAKFPEDAAALERMGELLLESGKAESAVAHLEQSVKASPTSANRFALAAAYNLTKQYAKAEPLLEQILQTETGDIAVRMLYARVLREQKKYGAAAQQFYRVTQAKPDSAEAWSDLAGMLILMEQYPQALAALDKVKALGAEKPAHHFFRAIILDRHQMYEPALESYERFLTMSEGKFPDEEFKARQRVRIIRKQLSKR